MIERFASKREKTPARSDPFFPLLPAVHHEEGWSRGGENTEEKAVKRRVP